MQGIYRVGHAMPCLEIERSIEGISI
jgi:hypothetical protein